MKTKKSNLSPTRIKWIRDQGYENFSDQEIIDISFGNRFAYQLCTSILVVGVWFCNIPILASMMGVAFLGVILPYHPFDYIYNHFLAKRMKRPTLPRRSNQLKAACTMATICIGATIYFAVNGLMIAATIAGYSLVVVAVLVATIDFCIPSIFYNAVIGKSKNKKILKHH